MLDLRSFLHFIRIVDLGSFSRAAEQLGITQPALSQQVAALETEFGSSLLHRTPKGVTPTAAGVALYGHLQAVLRHVEMARQDIRSSVHDPAGSVSIGIPLSVAEVLAAPLFLMARQRYPRIRLQIRPLPNRVLYEQIASHVLDFALMIEFDFGKAIRSQPVATEGIYLVFGATSRHAKGTRPISPEDLAGSRLILPCPPNDTRALLDEALAEARVTVDVIGEMDCQSAIVALAETGEVESVLAWSAISSFVASGRIRVRPIKGIRRRLTLCTSESVPLSEAGTAMWILTIDTMESLISAGTWPGISLLHGSPDDGP